MTRHSSKWTRIAVLAAVWIVGIVSTADAQVTLTQKYQEDSSHRIKTSVRVEQILKLGELSLDTKAETTIVLKMLYGKRDDQGQLPVETTFESIRSKIQLPGGVMVQFDSQQPAEENDNPIAQVLLDVLKKQKGATLKHVLSKDNQVGEISGVPEGSLVTAKSMRREFQQAAGMFPSEPVKVGDTWKRTTQTDLGNGQLFTIEREYVYQGTVAEFPTLSDSRKLEKISATANSVQFAIDPDGGLPLTVEKSELKIASSEGAILFDRESGRIVSHTDKTRIQGELALGTAGMNLEGTLDLSFKTKSSEVD